MSKYGTKLFQPHILDFTKLKDTDNVEIIIENTKHKFASDAEYSGLDIRTLPIFGTTVLINGKLISNTTFGMPFIRFHQKSKPKITYNNKTLFTFNIHYHGLNTIGSIDGASMEVIFGYSTQLGRIVTFQFPEITNNQSLLWYHSHNMFTSMELIYGGAVGLLQIVDKKTEWLTEEFEYGNNQILIMASDIDLTNTGTQTSENLTTDQNRSNFITINGISAVNWYSSDKVKFVNPLYHKTTKNLVKIDILNASLNWRVLHLGVCDEDNNIKNFYLVQTDTGLMNPKKLKMTFIPVASRISIIIDLNKFKNGNAYLFFYNYDLTEIFDSSSTFPNDPNNTSLTATIPNFKQQNATPYPTPIPDPNELNQQQNYTSLDYPQINLIEQTTEILENGIIKVPKKFTMKPFLKIIWKKKCKKYISLDDTLEKIRKTIFGHKLYNNWKHIIKEPFFEYSKNFNYLSFLNPNYYYNIPKLDASTPTRNFLLFSETNTNAISSGNVNGTTEYIDGTNRIMVDLWNSSQLDLNYAISQYNISPNNYKPTVLPTSKFRIYKTNDEYSNTAMISNDTLTIQFFNEQIIYGDIDTNPLYEITVIFPANENMNIQEFIDLINSTCANTVVENFGDYTYLSDIINFDWSFFPYQFNYLYDKQIFIKSAIIKTQNTSNYYIRFLGRWPLIQLFGKPMTGDILETGTTVKTCNIIKNECQYTKCDEYNIFGIYDADIQQIFPFYATSDGTQQLPIACMKRNAELIIANSSTYIGLYDGYWNDNLNSFSVKLKSTEIWLYNNGDNADSHPFHFHLTSGYAFPNSTYSSPNLLSSNRDYNPLIYTRDIYQIGPQQTIGFYLTWPRYSSDQQTKSPDIKGAGGMIHCHFLKHNDSNSMIIQYYIDPEFDNIELKIENKIENKLNKIETNKVIKKSKCCNK
jgi:FtsP/CotA-like multicopper oxidase with cupredoxin domain